MTRRASFKQADATKALRAAKAAGLTPSGFSIDPDGSIKVELGEPPAAGGNSFDQLIGAKR